MLGAQGTLFPLYMLHSMKKDIMKSWNWSGSIKFLKLCLKIGTLFKISWKLYHVLCKIHENLCKSSMYYYRSMEYNKKRWRWNREDKYDWYMFHVFMYFKFDDSSNINNKNLLEKNI